MSTNYTKPSDVPDSVLCDRLNELSEVIAKPAIRDLELTMRIPAECDRDADLVISEAARRIKSMAAEIRRLTKPGRQSIDPGKVRVSDKGVVSVSASDVLATPNAKRQIAAAKYIKLRPGRSR